MGGELFRTEEGDTADGTGTLIGCGGIDGTDTEAGGALDTGKAGIALVTLGAGELGNEVCGETVAEEVFDCGEELGAGGGIGSE